MIRASGNFRGNSLSSVADEAVADVLVRDFMSVDLSIRYNITPRWQVFADVININNERESSVFGGNAISGQVFEQVDEFGRTVQFGVVASF